MSQPITTDPSSPTPNSMPGAAPTSTQTAATQPPAATAPAAPTEAQKPTEKADAATATGSLTADERTELERLRAVRTEERIWEKRAKDNFEKAKQFDAIEESKKTEDQKRQERETARDLELVQTKQDLAREKVARETGVPPELIGGTTEEAMRSAAEVALAYRGSAAPQLPNSSAAPASSVTSDGKVAGPTQLSRDELAQLSPQDRMKAWRDGRLTSIGAGAPPAKPSVKVNT